MLWNTLHVQHVYTYILLYGLRTSRTLHFNFNPGIHVPVRPSVCKALCTPNNAFEEKRSIWCFLKKWILFATGPALQTPATRAKKILAMLEKKWRRIGGKPTLLQNSSQNMSPSDCADLSGREWNADCPEAQEGHVSGFFWFVHQLRTPRDDGHFQWSGFLSAHFWILFFPGTLWWSCRGNPCQRHSSRVFHRNTRNTHQVHDAVSTSINAVPEVLQEFRVVAANTQCKEGLTLNSLLPMPVLANAKWNAEQKEQFLQQTSHGCVMSHLRSWSCAGWMLTDPNENILAPEEKWPGCEPPKWAWSHVSFVLLHIRTWNLSVSNVVLIKFLPFLPSLLSLLALPDRSIY